VQLCPLECAAARSRLLAGALKPCLRFIGGDIDENEFIAAFTGRLQTDEGSDEVRSPVFAKGRVAALVDV
jgi:hypothetical protein